MSGWGDGCRVELTGGARSLRWVETGCLMECHGIMLTRARPRIGAEPVFWIAHWISEAAERQEADLSPHAAVRRLFESLKAEGLVKEVAS